MTPFILLFVGLLLLFLEFFLPGGILGIAGGVAIILSIVLFAINYNTLWAFLAFTLLAIGLVIFIVRFALQRLKKGKHIYHSKDQEGYFASTFAKEFIGKKGIAVTDLKPSGFILIDGKRVQAVSKMGYVMKGNEVEVIGGEGAHLIVKEVYKREEA